MLIGMTYDSKDEYLKQGFTALQAAEFDREETIELIAGTLRKLGHDVDRIGSIKSLTEALASGERWDLVFNIAEGIKGIARKASVRPAVYRNRSARPPPRRRPAFREKSRSGKVPEAGLWTGLFPCAGPEWLL